MADPSAGQRECARPRSTAALAESGDPLHVNRFSTLPDLMPFVSPTGQGPARVEPLY